MPDHQPTRAESALLTLLECAGPLTRAELADRCRLPRTTVTGIVGRLLERGLVAEQVATSAGVGRPPRTLSLAGPPQLVGVLSAGEAAVTASVLTYRGELLARSSAPLSAAGRDLLVLALREAGLAASRLAMVVVDVPGPVAPAEAKVRTAEIGASHVPVLHENDANLGALGEATFGAGRGLDSLIFVKLAHNVGAGLVLGGRLRRGATGYAGELAHVQVRTEGEGTVCSCGGRGCLAMLVGPSLVEFVQRAYEQRLALSEVLALAAERDPGVRRVFADLGRIIGRPLADLCTTIDPDAVVVDTTLGDAGEFVLAGIAESMDRHAAPVVADSLRVVAGQLGEQAEILGGVALAGQFRLDAAVSGLAS